AFAADVPADNHQARLRAGTVTAPSVIARQMRAEGVLAVILPKDRDPRFVTIRRGGTLTDSDHHLLALWAASCAEHVLDRFELIRRDDSRPAQAIEQARACA